MTSPAVGVVIALTVAAVLLYIGNRWLTRRCDEDRP